MSVEDEGISHVAVSYSNGTADIVYDERKTSQKEIVLLYITLQATRILNLLVPSQLADTKMGYGMLFGEENCVIFGECLQRRY